MKLENALSSPNVCFPNTKEGRKAKEMALVVVSRSPHPHKDIIVVSIKEKKKSGQLCTSERFQAVPPVQMYFRSCALTAGGLTGRNFSVAGLKREIWPRHAAVARNKTSKRARSHTLGFILKATSAIIYDSGFLRKVDPAAWRIIYL